MNLSSDQENAVQNLLKWFNANHNKQFITLGGYAGTGKSTLISILRKSLDEIKDDLRVAFCSYTGRATQNLQTKLKFEDSIYPQDKISTIHGLIYDPIENSNGEIVGWRRKDELEIDLIVIDEASMVDEKMWQDLISYKLPIIAVGDHGQLPPINGNFNLMEKPEIMLNIIHRQAEANPIIQVSKYARESGVVPIKKFGLNIEKHSLKNPDSSEISAELLQSYSPDTLILCGYNNTRNRINKFVRQALGFEMPTPQSGDRVICLRNNSEKNIFNGMLGTISNVEREDENWYYAEITMDITDQFYRGKIFAPQFGALTPINFTTNRNLAADGDLFDFGYALTVHKAQGSQAKRVVMFEERFKQMDDNMWKRWLYTGITRAEEELFLFGY